MRIFLCSTLLLFSFISRSSIVSGVAKDYTGEKIRLVLYTDQFCRQPIFVSEQIIAEDGTFKFDYNINSTQLAALKIKEYRSNFYLAPNAEYKIELNRFDPKSAPPLSKDKYLPAKLIEMDKDHINEAIGVLNVQLDSFEQKNYLAFLKKKAKPLVEDFIDDLKSNNLYSSNSFYKSYVDAVCGSLLYKAKFTDLEVYSSSLDKSIEYQNIAYVNLVNDFYHKWFYRYNLTTESDSIAQFIKHGELDKINTLLAENDFLVNDTLREIVIAKELFRLAVNDKKTDAVAVDKMLSKLVEGGITKENQQIASYYLTRLRKLGIGAEAPAFTFENENGNLVSLKDFRGKYVYLDFWATWCKPCLKSMQVMKQLYPKYKDNVEFISINIDERKKRFDRYLESNTYPWVMLYAGNNEQLKADYDIALIPLYYLIDPNGKLIQSPAFSPGGGIERTFKQLFETNTREEIKIWDWNFDPKNKGK